MEDSKKCFSCKIEKPLSQFKPDKRKYQLKADKKTCKVCNSCEFDRASKDLSVVRFNFEIEKFEVIKFENKEQVLKYFKDNEGWIEEIQ